MFLEKTKINVRPKKLVLFPKIGQAEFFLSRHHPHKSNVYENMYTHTNKKISTSKLIRTNLRFFPFKKQKIGPFVI